jgi:DNA-binding NarL/FixJ family response regulator
VTAPVRVVGQWIIIDRDALRAAEPLPLTDCPDDLRAVVAGRSLTERQLQVLRLVADGRTERQIAHELHMAFTTAKTHKADVFKALGARSAAHAVAIGFRHGLLK